MRSATRHPRRGPSRTRTAPARVVVERVAGPRVRLSAHGEFDLANAQVLSGAVLAQLDAERHSVALDMADVSFIDITAIESLLLVQRAFRSSEAALVLTGMSRQVSRVVRLLGLVDELTGDSELAGANCTG